VRLRIDLAYDGTDFHGWATQPGLRTVEDHLASALATSLRVPSVTLVCAGRTDAGVHARGQVVHVDVTRESLDRSAGRSKDVPAVALVRRLNGILPADIRVRRVAEAAAGFDARFSALWRRYAYRIADHPDLVDPLTRAHVLTWSRRLDLDLMNEASQALVGLHDFASYCKRREGATTTRTVLDLEWGRRDDGLVVGDVRADAFCHSMVRALVGGLLAVGDGRRPVSWPADVLAALQHDPGLTVAHAHGLTLEQVAYPVDDELAARNQLTRNRRIGGHP
jgi:tRNA pseudouridine38-40 synthase